MRDPRAALAETLHSIDRFLQETGRSRDDVLDVEALSGETGIPPEVVRRLLDGEDVPEEEFGVRIRDRIQHLRKTHLREDGAPHSLSAIGESFGSSGAAISAILNGQGRGPLAATQAGIEKFFFGRATGFLSLEAVPALDAALQSVIKPLKEDAHPGVVEVPSSRNDVRSIALRQARDLPEERWHVLSATLKALMDLDETIEGDR
ncbi:hypothetical protein [Streptomyces sp. NPDC059378]|uniref:hypothetical protein n=1 Tax=Streptomyces sp. NPDC059378 TaxID=3346815 RepID=UPI0036AFAD27